MRQHYLLLVQWFDINVPAFSSDRVVVSFFLRTVHPGQFIQEDQGLIYEHLHILYCTVMQVYAQDI